MDEAGKFTCTVPECGMDFANEDRLVVHMKTHDMVLNLGGLEPKGTFVADQTPTPTRFIRNCEEVGLFQDLQNVNPFDEGFKRAMETKAELLGLDHGVLVPDDVLHTPQMVFPLNDGENTLYTTNNQRNITISRSSSDENGVKGYETTTISKLTNQVTKISRLNKDDDQTNIHNDTDTTIIKIHSNVAIRNNFDRINDKIDKNDATVEKRKIDDIEVLLKLPNRIIKMKAVDDVDAKTVLKKSLLNKVQDPTIPSIPPGTFIPVTLVNSSMIPIPMEKIQNTTQKVPISSSKKIEKTVRLTDKRAETVKPADNILERKSAASKRYRERLKTSMQEQQYENRRLKEENLRLMAENTALKTIIMEHVKICDVSDDLCNYSDILVKLNKKDDNL